MKSRIKIDGHATTIWRHLPVTRPTGYRVREHNHPILPGFYGGHYHPRVLRATGTILEITESQSGLELWCEDEKLEVWPTQALAFEDIAAIDTTTNCITTKAGAVIPADVTRNRLSEEEYRIVQQERLIAAMSEKGVAHAAEGKKRSPAEKSCPTCGWVHDAQFTRIEIPGQAPLTLARTLSEIVACVHAAHERKLRRVSTKNEDLLRICRGYKSPSKAFHDLGQSAAYKLLFARGWGEIALRGYSRK